MVSRGDFKLMVRAVRAGSSWEQVKAAWSHVDPAWLDEHLMGAVLGTAGVSPSPVVRSSPEPKKRKKG